MRLIRYTDLGGNPVWVVDNWVQAIRKARDGEYQSNARTVIVMSGYSEGVQEDLDTARKLFSDFTASSAIAAGYP